MNNSPKHSPKKVNESRGSSPNRDKGHVKKFSIFDEQTLTPREAVKPYTKTQRPSRWVNDQSVNQDQNDTKNYGQSWKEE